MIQEISCEYTLTIHPECLANRFPLCNYRFISSTEARECFQNSKAIDRTFKKSVEVETYLAMMQMQSTAISVRG